MQGFALEWRTNFQREATTEDSKRGQSRNTVIRDPRILCTPLSKFLDLPLSVSPQLEVLKETWAIFARSFFLSLRNNNILSLMAVEIGNVGFCIFILICVLENETISGSKHLIFFFIKPPQTLHVCVCGGGGGIHFSRPSVRQCLHPSVRPFATFGFSISLKGNRIV